MNLLLGLNEEGLRLGAASAGHHDDKGHAGFRLRHYGLDRSLVHETVVDLFLGGGAEGHAMEAFLAPEIFTLDGDFFTGFRFVRFNFRNGRTFGTVTDRVALQFGGVRSLDRLGIEHRIHGALDHRYFLGMRSAEGNETGSEHKGAAEHAGDNSAHKSLLLWR